MELFFILPEELLENIFSTLSKEDILSVAYSSKKAYEIASRKTVLSIIISREYSLKRTPLDIPDFLYLIHTKCEIERFSIPVIPRTTLYCLLKHNLERISENLGRKHFSRLCSRLPENQAVFLYQKAFKVGLLNTNHRSNLLEDKDKDRHEFYNTRTPANAFERILKLYCCNDLFSSNIQNLASNCSREELHRIMRRCLKLGTNKNLRELLQLEQVIVSKELIYKSGKSLESFLLLKEKYDGEWNASILIQRAVKYETVDLIVHLVSMHNKYVEYAAKYALLRDWPELLDILEENKIKIPRVTLNLNSQRHSIRCCSSK